MGHRPHQLAVLKEMCIRDRYMSENYDRINLTVPKGQKEIIKAHAEAHSESVNGFVNRAIAETMERDNGAPAGPNKEE